MVSLMNPQQGCNKTKKQKGLNGDEIAARNEGLQKTISYEKSFVLKSSLN